MTRNFNIALLPVLFGFFVMGFCDLVGISTSYIKEDFGLSETMAGFVPSMVFVWFLIFAVPTATLMNKFGRKNMVQFGNLITIVGLIIPFALYNLVGCMVGFAFIGIGNTILQVSLNPLLTNVVKEGALASSLTAGQLIKAVSSLCGPFVAALALAYYGSWQAMFLVFAVITVISSVWLVATPILEVKSSLKTSSFGATFALLKDRTILLLFLGILFIVGTDVGMNTVTPKLLIERSKWAVDQAGFGSSLYFLCRTIGAFVGVVILRKVSERRYIRIHIIVALVAMALLFFAQNYIAILVTVGIIGFTCSCIFPVIYSMAMRHCPERANEISGLMITGVCGGALVTPLMGFAADAIGSQIGSLIIISICMLYLLFCANIKTTSTTQK